MENTFTNIYEEQLTFENWIIKKCGFANKDISEFDDKERVALCKELSLMLHLEISEFLNALGNYKKHKQSKDTTNIKDAKEEIADIIIFALDLALTMQMTSEELLEAIKKKQVKNFERQRTGY